MEHRCTRPSEERGATRREPARPVRLGAGCAFRAISKALSRRRRRAARATRWGAGSITRCARKSNGSGNERGARKCDERAHGARAGCEGRAGGTVRRAGGATLRGRAPSAWRRPRCGGGCCAQVEEGQDERSSQGRGRGPNALLLLPRVCDRSSRVSLRYCDGRRGRKRKDDAQSTHLSSMSSPAK